MLYGSIASALTLRFLRYFSSILYGCRAPVVSSRVITTTGPFVLSGFAAGVSVEGPIASVSVRLSAVGRAAFVGFDVAIDSDGGVLCVCGFSSGFCAVGTLGTVSEADAVGVDDGTSVVCRVLISTGLVDSGAWLLDGRDPVCCVCEGLWAAVGAAPCSGTGEAIPGGLPGIAPSQRRRRRERRVGRPNERMATVHSTQAELVNYY